MKRYLQKIFAFFIAFCLCAFAIETTDILALDNTQQNVHLHAPQSVCATDDTLYISDKQGEQNVLHIFTATQHDTLALANTVSKMKYLDGKIFMQAKDTIYIFDVATNAFESLVATGIVDFDVTDTTLYTVFVDGISQNDLATIDTVDDISQAKNIVAPGSGITGVAIDGNNIFYIDDGILYKKSSVFESVATTDVGAKITFAGETRLVYCGSKINGVDLGFDIANVYALSAQKIFVASTQGLCVSSFRLEDNSFVQNGLSIGINHKDYDTSYQAIDNFEKLQVYKTNKTAFVYGVQDGNDSNSKYGYLDVGTTVLKLAETNGFSYILYALDNKGYFGFVANSELTKVSITQQNVKRVAISSDEKIYLLPVAQDTNIIKNGDGTDFLIENSHKIDLICYVTGFDSDKWSFVKIDDKYGFMLNEKLKDPPVEQYVANPSVGKSLAVYADASKSSKVLANIASGTVVTVFEDSGNFWKVSVEVDGTEIEGWIESRYLIPKGSMTDTVSLGLAIGITLVLVIGFALVWGLWHKKKSKNND